jgi:hypothetical protein
METDRILDLTDLATASGPFLSIRITTEPAVPNAGPRSHLRWHGLRQDLVADGVPEGLLDRVDPFVADAHRWGRVLHVVVTGEGGVFVDHAAREAGPDERAARYEWLPWTIPVLAARQRRVPHLVVLTDRRGADLVVVRRDGVEIDTAMTATEEPIPRVAQSDWHAWAEHRYQQRAENSWERNAGEVATEVIRLARWAEPRAIYVAGDVRAVQFLRDDLPDDLAALVRVVDGERLRPRGNGGVTGDVTDLLEAEHEVELGNLLARFAEEAGQRDRAVAGFDQTIAALAGGQVATLLIAENPDDVTEAWFGTDPSQLAVSEAAAEALGWSALRPGRRREAAVRAAMGTGAEVRVVPRGSGPAEDIGALLRWV